VLAVDLQGQIIAQATRSYPLFTHSQVGPSRIHRVEASLSALSDVTGQLDGHRALALVCLDKCAWFALNAEGRVIRPAILWNDQRTGKAVAAIEATISRQELIGRTGNHDWGFNCQISMVAN